MHAGQLGGGGGATCMHAGQLGRGRGATCTAYYAHKSAVLGRCISGVSVISRAGTAGPVLLGRACGKPLWYCTTRYRALLCIEKGEIVRTTHSHCHSGNSPCRLDWRWAVVIHG